MSTEDIFVTIKVKTYLRMYVLHNVNTILLSCKIQIICIVKLIIPMLPSHTNNFTIGYFKSMYTYDLDLFAQKL